MKLTLINHACCKVETKSMGILCDPWVEGTAFNNGWDLLIKTPLDFDAIMENVSYIWVSHEHPDHFSIPFLSRVAKTHKDKVIVLFQKTRDKRVLKFCTSQGLRVQELEDRVSTKLNDEVSVICGVCDFYDSWLHITDGKHSVLNINDCHTRSDKDAENIANSVPPEPTVMWAQFSYASWKGGRENAHYRKLAAEQKLETLGRQVRIMRPKYTVPFASLVYFSNQENNYLNDYVNTPAKAVNAIQEAGSQALVLYPGDSWNIEEGAIDNSKALALYEKTYAELDKLPLRDAGASSSVEEIKAAFQGYRERVYSKNSSLLINMLSKVSPLHVFEPLTIELYDIGALLSMSVVKGIFELKPGEKEADVRMHSSSFLFILKNEFGFDTLMVNGRFETSTKGFSKMTKSLAIGSLNAMGLSLSLKLLEDFRVIIILLKILGGVLSRLKLSEKSAYRLGSGGKILIPFRSGLEWQRHWRRNLRLWRCLRQ